MAGIGVRLHKIFDKEQLTAKIYGFGYSIMFTISPVLVVIINIMLMQLTLGNSSLEYSDRNLYAATILYIFIFALITSSPFNAVISKYLADIIYNETYSDILACFYAGLGVNMALSCAVAIPFCLWVHFVGEVSAIYVFTGYCGYVALVFVFYSMIYLSVCKAYGKISWYFTVGMLFAYGIAYVCSQWLKMDLCYSELLGLTIGFLIIGIQEFGAIRHYFPDNSHNYRALFAYFRKYWQLIFANAFYIMGLYVHNFVIWTTDMRIVVAKSFVMAPAYDMATCLAMFTNLTASVIFIVRVEMYFHQRYRAYSEAVIGGRLLDIENAKGRMFRQLSRELMSLLRLQFIITVVLYLVCVVFLPKLGFAGIIMQIYPATAAAYFVMFIMYAEIIFLYYYNDLKGAILTSLLFFIGTLGVTWVLRDYSHVWYGMGLFAGSLIGFSYGYHRLRWVEKHLDKHIFCQGILYPIKRSSMPDTLVYSREQEKQKKKKQEAECL